MATNTPFFPTANSFVFTAGNTAPTAVQVVSPNSTSAQYLVQNAGAVTVFMGVGNTANAANTNAVTVTANSAAVPLLPGTAQVFTFFPNAFFTGVASANSAVYITPGEGL